MGRGEQAGQFPVVGDNSTQESGRDVHAPVELSHVRYVSRADGKSTIRIPNEGAAVDFGPLLCPHERCVL